MSKLMIEIMMELIEIKMSKLMSKMGVKSVNESIWFHILSLSLRWDIWN